MYRIKRITALMLCVAMLAAFVPQAAFAADEAEDGIYQITNRYLIYSYNAKTGGFAIETDEGHPKKKYDNNMPLLYAEDSDRSNGTSFVTVRINGDDYIFGQSYGFFNMATTIGEPVISEGGRLMEIDWSIKGITVTMSVALGTTENTDTIGNAGLAFEVTNNSGSDAEVSVRLLLDTALGEVDAPYIVVDDSTTTIAVETEWSGESVPSQIRNVDSLTNTRAVSYILPKGWQGGVEPTKIIAGHWANLANTRYEYTADKYCDFTNASNTYRVADAAVALYWEGRTLSDGESYCAETLYGIGNFSSDTGEYVGINVTDYEKLEMNSSEDGYENNGEFTVVFEIDNTLDDSIDLTDISIAVTAEDEYFEVLNSSGDVVDVYQTTYDQLLQGGIITDKFTLRARPQQTITSGTFYISLTGYAMIDNVLIMVETMATRTIVLPSVTNAKAYIDMSTVNPEIVYTEGEKAVTISGNMKEFKALEGNEGWALYLRHTTSDHEVVIEKSKVAFLDDSYSSMSFTTTEELEVGFYSIEFEFTDTNLISAFGNKLTAGGELQVSADETYALKSYSLMSLVRRTDTSTNHTWYDFIAFTDEGDYQSFYDGKTQKTGLINKTVIQHNFGENKSATMEYEILLTVRGKLREMEDAKKGVYWQADYADGSITINNILSYEGSEPLQMYYSSGSYVIEGNGLLKVVNSINVWRSEWSYTVRDEIIYSLNPDRTSSLVGNINELTLSFGGAATMIQSIGGFLMDLSYGVMSSEWFDEGDGQVTYNIAFGGTVSIPISSKSNSDDDEASSAANNIKSADDDDEDFYIVDVSTGQVTSGATSSTSTTTTTSSTGTTTKKKSGLSGAQISADLKEVMFGEMGNVEDGKVVVEGIGFEGINTTITLGLPDNVLGSFIKNDSGLEVTMTINTLNNIYELDASIKIMIIECEATLGFKQVTVSGSDKVVPNNIAFYVKTETGGVPLVTPILYLNGLGGGIYNLADTIGGNFTTLPPVTLSLYMGLNALNLLYGDFTATASLSGLSLTGELTFKGNKSVLLVEAGISAQWTTPWNLSLYGKANFLSGVLKGTISVTIAQNYFYGYVSVTLMIPDEIFLIGGLELAKVEGAVSNTFVGGNVIILGLQYGFIYYWATGEFDLSTSIDLSAQTMSVTDEDGNEAVLIYATNMTPLKTTKVETDEDEGVFRLMDAGSAVSETAADVSGTDGIYAMLIEVPYTGNGMPSIWNLTLESPSGDEIALEASDNNGGGNFMIQDRGNSGKYIYISVTDQSLIEDGVWTLKSSADNVTLGDMNMRAVAKIPELSATSFSYDENDPFALDVSWTTDATRAIEGYVDVYLTDDADVLTKMKNSDNGTTLGYNAAHVDLGSIGDGSVSIELPEGLDSGEYYVVTMLSQQDGISYVMSADTLKFTNPNLPNSVKSVNVKYGGNGDLYIEIEDADDVDYTDYLVEITAVDGTELTNNFNRYSIDEEYIYIGKEAELEADKEYVVNVRTLRETTIQPSAGSSEAAETIYYYGSDTVSSDAYTMPEIAKPQLLSVETDFTATDNNIASDAVTITYTFDRPVWMMLDSRGESVYQVTNEFKEVWTFELTDMEDGEYIIDFTAYAKTKDYVTGADFPDVENAQIGFNVDTSPPLLTLAMTDATTIDGDETTAAMNVVTADAQGYYSFGGLTELEAEMTVDGVSDSNLKVDSFGSFTYSGKLADGEKGTQHLLKAVDKAGNTAQLMVYVVSGNVSEIEKIELWNGEDNVTNGEITLDVGSTADLTVRAYYADDEDSYWEISGEEIEWEMLYENTLIRLMDGSVTALASGETALMATLPTAVMTKGDTQSTIGYSAYTIITINPGLTVTYNANGGNGAPGKDTDLAAGEYTLNSVLIPSHSNAADGTAIVFIGWSETKDETIYAKGDTVPTTVTKISLADDTTVYALWGYDTNENGTADVTEETYNLTYDANGGTSVPDAVSGLLTGEYTLSEAVPMHGNDADGNEIIFIGWSETEDATIYAKGDTTPTTVTQVTVAKDTIVYAVWGYDINENGTADVFEDTYTVSYNVNGGNGEVDTDTEVLSGAHKLSAAVPTHDDENGVTVVFIGWSETQYGTIFSSIDDMPNVVEEITVSGDTLVYAAWGYDENGNGIADIVEGAYTVSYTLEHVTLTNEAEYVIKGHGYTTEVTADGEHTISSVSVVMAGQDVTDEVYDAEKGIITISAVTGDVVITIKADQNRYTLSYDANDGDGAPTNEIGLLAGTHALSATVPTHDAVGGIAVLFIGWSLTKDAHVYAKGETAPQTVTSVTIAGDTTVYAVWGYDENENGTPDVDEDTYTLTYDANGGNNDAPDDETELLANTYTLSSVIPTHADDSNAKVVFIGWSETKDAHIYTESDTAPTTITRVTVAGDTTVYAVWGYDANNNGTADVLEGTYTIVYVLENVELDNTAAYVIAAEGYSANITVKEGCTIAEASVTMADQDITDTAYNGGTITIDSVTGNVIITIKAALNRYTVSYDANGGNDAPTNETGVLAGEYKLNTSIPTHLDENNIAVIFIGWSETKSSEIYAKGGTAPTTVTSITVAGDTTVYAAWGYDENSNGIADVNEETYTLTYDANDGNYAPDKATGLLADTYALSADTPTHADDNNTKVTFIGWSIAKDAKIYAKGETAPTTVTSVEVSEDTTVYAVWGYDENENGIADVFEETYTVTYDVNGGEGTIADDTGILTGTQHTLSASVPTHTNVNNTAVVFIGWSTEKDAAVYTSTDTMPTVIQIAEVTGSTTVYAVWGYDENGNGIADIIEGAYTVTYSLENVTLTNEAEYVISENGYTTTIKAHDGHTIESVVVTMGGEDITSEAYSKGTITIASVTGDVVITAKAALNRYSVYYDANGGDNAPANDTGVLAGTHKLSITAPTHNDEDGYAVIFIGWSEAKDETIYAKGMTAPTTVTSVEVSVDTTVYALWGYDENENGIADVFEKTYTVSYDANDGTGAPADETLILTGTHHTLSAAVPTHADVNDTAVVFIGWSTAQDAHIYGANDDIPNVITSMTVTENTTLYAVWGYDENTNGTADVIEGAHTFTYSWENITSDNETEYVIANGSYTATLTPNAGYAIASVTVTMDGVDITSEAYNAETGKITIASVTGEVKITAEAELIRYSVAYDANGGKGEMTDENSPYGYGETATVLENTFTRSSYKFDGWNTAADGSGISYSAGDELTVNADVTLCAQWKRTGSGGGGGGSTTITQYTVTFNTNGGSTIGSVKVDKNDTLSEPEEPTKSGYEFAGWYTSAELTSEYDFDAKVTENFTLYAKWTAEESGKGAADDEHDCPSKKFTDVDTNLWYHEYIDYALENGIMNGTSTTTFEPDTAITRGMIVTMLYRLEDEPEADAAYGFDDVAEGMYYTDAIAWSAENEIIYGYGDGNFGPDDAITREQMAAIMYRYAQYKGYDVSVGEDTNILSFDDALEISEYAIAAMQWACGCGLIEGTGTALEPAGTATRAQAAAIFTRACEMMKKAE